MKKPTVSQELYKILAERGDWVASGELEGLHVLGATGSTITRKLRALHEAKYLEVRYEGKNHAHYRALKTKAEREAYTPPIAPVEAPKLPSKAAVEVSKPKYRYDIVIGADGQRKAVPIPV